MNSFTVLTFGAGFGVVPWSGVSILGARALPSNAPRHQANFAPVKKYPTGTLSRILSGESLESLDGAVSQEAASQYGDCNSLTSFVR